MTRKSSISIIKTQIFHTNNSMSLWLKAIIESIVKIVAINTVKNNLGITMISMVTKISQTNAVTIISLP